MEDLDLNAQGKRIGQIVRDRFSTLQKVMPQIGDVRGVGAMIGIEFVKDNDPTQPDGDLCTAIVQGCAEQGLIVISAGSFKNVIRILSPLVITDDQLNRGLDILESEIVKAINQ
jgi:4-aminobutyrate aminotransferase/(S)-3-amino-2-methylpropionate transaminase